MKKRTRNILIAAGFVALFFVGALLYVGYNIYSFVSHFAMAREIPAELKETGVLKGAGAFTRTEFFKLDRHGLLKVIGDAAKIKDEKEREKMVQSQTALNIYGFSDIKMFADEIIAVGKFGAFVFDLSGAVKKQIFFEPVVEKTRIGPYETETYQSSLGKLSIVRLEANKYGFLSFDLTQGARVFDADGNEIWSIGKEPTDLSVLLKDEKELDEHYEKQSYVLQAAVGDLDNDGVSEYLVARKSDGIRAYDRSGNERWFVPADYPNSRMEVVDLDGDGKNELLELGENVRDGNGKILRTMKGADKEALLTVDRKTQKLNIEFLTISENKLICSSEDGQTLLKADAPLSDVKTEPTTVSIPGHPEMSYTDDSETVGYPNAVWITFRKGQPPYLAVAASFIGFPRAHLYIYGPGGNLVFHDLLDENAETAAVMPAADGSESLLIGGKDTIWKYTPN